MDYPKFSGSIVAIITPFLETGQIDFPSLENLVNYHIASKTDAILVCGTTGEPATMSEEETLEVIKFVVKIVNKRIKVIAGTGSNCTHKAIAYTKKVEKLGVDAFLSVVPYYNKPSQEGLYQHFKAIACSSDIPVLLYNVPGRTVTSLDIDTIVRLSQISNIIGIKDAHPDLSRVAEIVRRTRDNGFVHFSGDDPNALDAIVLGSSGIISVSANVIAAEWAEIIHTALAGDLETARKLNDRLDPVHTQLFLEPNPAPAKYIAYKLGLIKHNHLRLPLLPVSEATARKLDDLLVAIGKV